MPLPKRSAAKKAVRGKKISEVQADGAGPAEAAPGEGTAPVSARQSRRILLVDDDEEIVESMRAVLESKGYEIIVARDGNQGLLLAERETPDLIVLDMMMPKRSGFLVLEQLRRSRPVPVKVVMITANEGSRHRAYAEMLGVDDYIRKPFAMDRLLATVQRLLADGG
ncbi:MAG: response regulator transcription factor [Planctomycetota bacterium]